MKLRYGKARSGTWHVIKPHPEIPEDMLQRSACKLGWVHPEPLPADAKVCGLCSHTVFVQRAGYLPEEE